MSRMLGTVSRGVRAPIIRSGDDLVEIVTASVLEAANQEKDGFEVRDRDVIAMTEAIVARAQGNYASVDDIAADVKAKLGGETVGVTGRVVFIRNTGKFDFTAVAHEIKIVDDRLNIVDKMSCDDYRRIGRVVIDDRIQNIVSCRRVNTADRLV